MRAALFSAPNEPANPSASGGETKRHCDVARRLNLAARAYEYHSGHVRRTRSKEVGTGSHYASLKMSESLTACRVRREDLDASDGDWSEGGDDAEIHARLNAQLARALGLDHSGSEAALSNVSAKQEVPMEPDDDAGAEAEDDGYEFRLFSTSAQAPRIVLEDDNVPTGNGGILAPRPLSYYLVTDVSEGQKKQYEFAAMTGDDVLAQSRWKAPGLELPWKLNTIKTTPRKSKKSSKGSSSGSDADTTKRKRPGKKRRIALRTKERAKKAEAEELAKKKTEKEELVKDKKKRLNRLKKLRKRAKEKEKKLADRGEGGADGSESENDSDDSQ